MGESDLGLKTLKFTEQMSGILLRLSVISDSKWFEAQVVGKTTWASIKNDFLTGKE